MFFSFEITRFVDFLSYSIALYFKQDTHVNSSSELAKYAKSLVKDIANNFNFPVFDALQSWRMSSTDFRVCWVGRALSS